MEQDLRRLDLSLAVRIAQCLPFDEVDRAPEERLQVGEEAETSVGVVPGIHRDVRASDSEAPLGTMGAPAGKPLEARRMPVVHRFGPYRFFFYSHENQDTREQPHVHVISANGEASFWLTPVALRQAWGYTRREIEQIRRIIVVHRSEILRRWDDFFDA